MRFRLQLRLRSFAVMIGQGRILLPCPDAMRTSRGKVRFTFAVESASVQARCPLSSLIAKKKDRPHVNMDLSFLHYDRDVSQKSSTDGNGVLPGAAGAFSLFQACFISSLQDIRQPDISGASRNAEDPFLPPVSRRSFPPAGKNHRYW